MKSEKTDYFLAGGFDFKKKKGMIKLFKINYRKDDDEMDNIEFIEDLFCEKDNEKELNCL